MLKIEQARVSLGQLDQISRQTSVFHALDARAKLIPTLLFILCIVSYDKYQLASLFPFCVYPVVLVAIGRIPFRVIGYRLLLLSPFALIMGAANPLLDTAPLMQWGSFSISGGWISFFSILLRFSLSVGTGLILICLTSFEGLCFGLQRLGVPKVFTLQLLFLYRYIYLLFEEVTRLIHAYNVRSFGAKRVRIRVYGSLVGQLLIRTLGRAQRIHQAMECRGFQKELKQLQPQNMDFGGIAFLVGWSLFFIVLRWTNPISHLGDWLVH